jgi:hypothetical protein
MVGTVGLGTAVEVVALDDAGEALALGDTGHVDHVPGLEQVADREDLADRHVIDAVDAELADRGDLGQVLELAGLRLVQPLGDLGPDLDRV